MRKLALITALAAAMLAGGCKYDEVGGGVGDRPVAPKSQSYERSRDGEPQLPYMKPWWED